MLTARHEGFGKWAVMDGAAKVASGLTKDEATARTAVEFAPKSAAGALSEVVHPPIPADWPEDRRRREYERRLNEWDRQERFAIEGKVKDWLMTEFGHDEDTATRLSMAIAPMIAAGREGVNRNLARNRRGATPQPAA